MLKRDFSRAKQVAFQLLKFRSRSKQEIIDRLKRKKFPEEIISQALDFLERLKYLDDEQFALSFCQSRLAKPFGFRRIFFELKQKGVSKEIIEQTLEKFKQSDYSESEVVTKIAREKFKKIKTADKYKAKARVYAFLIRRGFNPETVKEAVETL